MSTEMPPVSDEVHTFVQSCQVAVGGLCHGDLSTRLSPVWVCFRSFPAASSTDVELLTGVVAVAKIACGFFGHVYGKPLTPVPSRRPSRRHVNTLLTLVVREYGKRGLTLSAIADFMNLSQPYLSRILQLETRSNFAAHLNGVRLLSVIDDLRTHGTRMNDVAARAGYRSNGELDRQFKKTFGLTPRRFRSLARVAPRPLG